MTELAGLRRELLIQSEINRRLLCVRCSEIREAASWLDTGFSMLQKIRPFAAFLAPVLGFMAARSWRRPEGMFSKIRPALKLCESIQRLWQGFSGK